MATVILVRHGRTSANASGTLAGRLPGVRLDDVGHRAGRAYGGPARGRAARRDRHQPARALPGDGPGDRRAPTPPGRRSRTERGLTECDYGEWQGRPLRELAKEKLWATVQSQPSAATFPGGESLPAMQARAVNAVRRRDAAVEAEHGPGAVWVAVTHGDIVKSILADALGMHLDLFQRIQVDPASVSIVRYTSSRPYVLATNTHEGDLSWLAAKPSAAGARKRRATPRSVVAPGPAAPSAPS